MDLKLTGLFIGTAVGDASSVGVEWIYDLNTLEKVCKERGEAREFLDPCACPFFTLATGQNSCYFHQTFVVAESLVEKQGFDIVDLQERLFKAFGPGTPYEGTNYVLCD